MTDLDYERWIDRNECHRRTKRLRWLSSWLEPTFAVVELVGAVLSLHGIYLWFFLGWWGVPLAGVLLALAGGEGRKWLRRARWELNLPG